MNYPVRISPTAKSQLFDAATWWAENRDPSQASRWLEGFDNAIASLGEDPERYPVAEENDQFPMTLRQILFGAGRNNTHRAVYEIRGVIVLIHAIRHLAQREISPDEL